VACSLAEIFRSRPAIGPFGPSLKLGRLSGMAIWHGLDGMQIWAGLKALGRSNHGPEETTRRLPMLLLRQIVTGIVLRLLILQTPCLISAHRFLP
jgi:hypothetical protein